ncbi:hypothetical protein FEM48_Zijuj04G0010200 [Ziziphus jujuba var. spinosa]|uniref:COBRA-like protein n=1 Tax=Ziziphus jujuba var. spinosa TaxID=714518 RepID=A0A978VGX7_ZIZJJ|nr:hypothetical protein FEM48_Zijuj04G0010200 [Ziziphus jujuba var. spinosa]
MILILTLFSLITSLSSSYGYDPLDPHANITITWDFILKTDSSYDITVSIHNFQLFRHIEKPGWKLGWTWKEDEVIWNMWGAEATEQGNCSKFIGGGGKLPHCCEKNPTIVDLMPGAPYNMQVSNCCKGGVLTSMVQDYSKSLAAFRMVIGSFSNNITNINMPFNFSLGLPGYSCGDPFHVPPTKFSHDGGRRFTQALGEYKTRNTVLHFLPSLKPHCKKETWNVTCSYSQFRSSPAPKCCVSLSAFYNDTIVPCPQCSCNCQGLPGTKCVKPGETPSLLELPPTQVTQEVPPLVMCSHHMCPIRVHWHVKQSYRQYWRVKITITNLNFVKNYSQWNLVVQHPNLQSLTQVFSFSYHDLHQYGNINDTGMFWGIQYYNDMLLVSGSSGNVQSEILLRKDPGHFTFREGWAFPRRISFNADECVMPLPDDYPRLPNSRGHSSTLTPPSLIFFLSLFSFAFL